MEEGPETANSTFKTNHTFCGLQCRYYQKQNKKFKEIQDSITRVCEYQETVEHDQAHLNASQVKHLEVKTVIVEIKNSVAGLSSKSNTAGERASQPVSEEIPRTRRRI